jgi:hypothetical protein
MRSFAFPVPARFSIVQSPFVKYIASCEAQALRSQYHFFHIVLSSNHRERHQNVIPLDMTITKQAWKTEGQIKDD